MHWALFSAIALLLAAFFMLTMAHRQLERRFTADEGLASKASEEARRAHARLDNQQRQIEAIARQLGWADDHAHTKVLTERLPQP